MAAPGPLTLRALDGPVDEYNPAGSGSVSRQGNL